MSGYPWFRLYHEARIDAKLRTLPCEQFRVWFNLLCYAAENYSARGTVPAMDDDLLAVEVSNGDTDLLCATVERLKKLRILEADEDGALLFIHFEKRQWDKPSARPERNAARQRDLRARRKAEGAENSNASNAQSRARNAKVTRGNAQSNASNDTDKKRRDTDKTRREDTSPSDDTLSSSSNDTQQHTREPLTLVRTGASPSAPVKKRNPIWDTLVELFEQEPETKQERSNWGKIVKDLTEAGATADEMRRRASNHAAGVLNKSISWPLTPNALNTHWGELARAPRPLREQAQRNASNTPADDSGDALSAKAQREMARYAAAVGDE